jgi:LysR family transcriptional regulator, glycine cleavage system transcriptional activator
MTSLRVFESAARHLSFSDAANELSLTQSAVSRQIRALEEFLDLKLFHRIRNRLKLTEAAAAYLPEVRACLSRLEAASLELLAHQGTGGVLNLAILPTFGTKWLIPRMSSFWRAHPHIIVNFTTRSTAFDFSKERLDAAIHFGDVSWPGVSCYRLMGEEVVPVCAPALLNTLGLACVDDLARHTLLQHTTRPNAWVEWLAAAGTPEINGLKGPRFEHFLMMIQAAIAGIGVAVLPRFLIEDEVAAGRLVIPFNVAVRSDQAYYLVHPEEKADLPALRSFREWLLREVHNPTTRPHE